MFAWAGDLPEFAGHRLAPDVEIGVGVPQNVIKEMAGWPVGDEDTAKVPPVVFAKLALAVSA